jgi:hypothetical protein
MKIVKPRARRIRAHCIVDQQNIRLMLSDGKKQLAFGMCVIDQAKVWIVRTDCGEHFFEQGAVTGKQDARHRSPLQFIPSVQRRITTALLLVMSIARSGSIQNRKT